MNSWSKDEVPSAIQYEIEHAARTAANADAHPIYSLTIFISEVRASIQSNPDNTMHL